MVNQDVLMEKAGNIRRCLKRIKDTTNLNPDTLRDIDKQDIFVLNLQRAVQSTIDLAAHVVADESLGWAENLRDNFQLLYQANIIPDALNKSMQSMVGFRNIAVHEYQSLKLEILQKILTDYIDDLELFYQTILKYYEKKADQ